MNLKFNFFLITVCSFLMTTTSHAQTGCDAQFSYSYTTCDSIFFYIDSIDPQAYYSWNFGDGDTGSGYYTSNQYAGDGTYYVSVIVQDSTGCIDTASATVVVDCANSCIIHAGFTATDTTGCAVVFSPSVSGGTAPYSYDWTFGDGGTSSYQYPTHTYSSSGTYNVCLTVTDSNGCDTTYCNNILVSCNDSTSNCNVTPDFTYSQDSLGCGFYFNSSISGGTAPYSYYWTFGDGTTSVAENPYHSYDAAGTYAVCLTVIDANGCDSSWCENVAVNCTPNNNCIMHPYFTTQIDSTCGVSFTSSNSGGSTPYSYYWDLGDGATSYVEHPYHTYSSSGTYTVCLTITDSSGCDSTFCDDVTVNCGTMNISDNTMEPTVFEVNIYPNPGTGIYTVDLSEKADIVLFDISGQIVFRKTDCQGKTPFDITEEARGIYLLQVVSDSEMRTIKIIKR